MHNFEFPVSREGPVARLDLGRPEEGNALTRAMMLQLATVIRNLGAESDTRTSS